MGCQRPGQVGGLGLGSYLGQLAHGQEKEFEAYCLERSALCHSGASTHWQLENHLLPAPQSKLGAAGPLAWPVAASALACARGRHRPGARILAVLPPP